MPPHSRRRATTAPAPPDPHRKQIDADRFGQPCRLLVFAELKRCFDRFVPALLSARSPLQGLAFAPLPPAGVLAAPALSLRARATARETVRHKLFGFGSLSAC